MQDVPTPTCPDNAEQRDPSQRIPPSSAATKRAGNRSRAASLSMENRGQSAENEQHAPHDWQSKSFDKVITVSYHGADRNSTKVRHT
jgi:hypothetical protein